MKLKAIVAPEGATLGNTPSGVDWCVKALHPADPITEVRGIPDRSSVPTVFQNYQSAFTFGASAGSVGTWSFTAALLPHPIDFMYCNVIDSHGGGGTTFNFNNPQLTGATHAAKYAALLAMATRWRLAYCSATMYLNAPDLSNQGMMVGCQVPVRPRKFFTGGYDEPAGHGTLIPHVKVMQYQAADIPVFANIEAYPNAYVNRAREGMYMPLKLTDTCQRWFDRGDEGFLASETAAYAAGSIELGVAMPPAAWPHEDMIPAHGHVIGASICSGYLSGDQTCPMLSGVFGEIAGQGIDVASTITVYFRYGIEMQVMPTSTLAPQLKLSPPYDPVALDHYFQISRELKDAYPADYNDLGKIWKAIKEAIPMIAGVAGQVLVPGSGQFAAKGATAIMDRLDSLGRAIKTNRNLPNSAKEGISSSAPKRKPPKPPGRKPKAGKKKKMAWPKAVLLKE